MDMEINRSEYCYGHKWSAGIRASKERKSGFNTTGRYDAGYERI